MDKEVLPMTLLHSTAEDDVDDGGEGIAGWAGENDVDGDGDEDGEEGA